MLRHFLCEALGVVGTVQFAPSMIDYGGVHIFESVAALYRQITSVYVLLLAFIVLMQPRCTIAVTQCV